MFVILTSKPGQFRTEPVPGVEPVETYEYLFYGRPKAIFVIATLAQAVKVPVIDETGGASGPRCRRWRTSAAWTSL